MTNENMNYDKAKIFLERKIKVHVVKTNGTFYNGFISEISKSQDFFIIEDIKEGPRLIFFAELNEPIEEYITRWDTGNV